jgi:hypothetical protein
MGDDLLMLRNGQMLILRENQLVALQEEICLIDGTRIALDGRVITADGTYQALVEGQAILVDSRGTAS